MFRMIAKGIEVRMLVGICEWERQRPQTVIVNAVVWGHAPLRPKSIAQCLDYSKICDFVQAWAKRPHVDLVETLLADTIAFCFEDARVCEVDIEVIKPQVIDRAEQVGVGARLTRAEFEEAFA